MNGSASTPLLQMSRCPLSAAEKELVQKHENIEHENIKHENTRVNIKIQNSGYV